MRIRANLSKAISSLLLAACAGPAIASGKLVVERAWIRAAPPGAMMLAGYAVLRNVGDERLTITSIDSPDFATVSLHESFAQDGVEHMRPLGDVSIAAGASVEFAPGGKHFMLMQPKRDFAAGAKAKIHISTNSGNGVDAEFVIGDAPP